MHVGFGCITSMYYNVYIILIELYYNMYVCISALETPTNPPVYRNDFFPHLVKCGEFSGVSSVDGRGTIVKWNILEGIKQPSVK